MARKSGPWWRAGRKMWYVQVKGKQIGLGVTDPNGPPQSMVLPTKHQPQGRPASL